MNLPDTIALGRLGGVVGKFRLEKKLGSGAMGDVYLGVHTTLGNHVAIKILNAAASAEVAGVERFLNEAHAVAKLGHENIVAVIDQDRLPDGTPFIVMEYVEGENVRDLLSRGPMSFARAARIATDVLAALAVAHANGVIHRDLKPENVRVTPNGRAKVLDFGVAKVLNKPSTQVTVQGAIVGTPHYMAPEQVASAPVDGRADVYAVGVMLFECATGHRPFDGESLVELLQQQMHAPPPAPRSLRPEVPEPLERVILKALEKEPARRFSSAADMSAALAAVMPQLLPELATPPAPMAASSGGPVTATPSAAYVPTKREARASSSPQNAAELNSPFSSLPTTLRERTPNRMGLAMAAALAGLAAVVAAVTLGPWGGSLERPDAPRDAVAPSAPTVSPTPSLVVVAPGSATRPGPPPGDPDSPEAAPTSAAPTSAAPLNRPVGDPDSLANPPNSAALPHQPGAVDSEGRTDLRRTAAHRPVGALIRCWLCRLGARPMKPGDGSAAGRRRVALADPPRRRADYDQALRLSWLFAQGGGPREGQNE